VAYTIFCVLVCAGLAAARAVHYTTHLESMLPPMWRILSPEALDAIFARREVGGGGRGVSRGAREEGA
jgi:hypothetical protein